MNEEEIYQKLVKICGSRFVSSEQKLLESYSTDLSYVKGYNPNFVVWVNNTKQIEKILKLANTVGFSVVPISSSLPIRYHGDTIPLRDNSIILDLSKMNRVLNIDRKNRVIIQISSNISKSKSIKTSIPHNAPPSLPLGQKWVLDGHYSK